MLTSLGGLVSHHPIFYPIIHKLICHVNTMSRFVLDGLSSKPVEFCDLHSAVVHLSSLNQSIE